MAANHAGSLTRRPVEPADEEFLRAVYASTRAEELALTNWDAAQRDVFIRMQFAAQHQHYFHVCPRAAYEVVLLDGRPVGRIHVDRREQEIRILDLTVLAEHRNAGIGALIPELIAEAAQAGTLVTVYVEGHNRSRRLFERLGFVEAGGNGFSVLLQWCSRG